MKVLTVAFTLARTIPLISVTGRPEDQYANLKPEASVTIQLDSNEGLLDTAEGVDLVRKAFEDAAQLCYDEVSQFNRQLHEEYKKRATKPGQ